MSSESVLGDSVDADVGIVKTGREDWFEHGLITKIIRVVSRI